jgi:hypothetical protein
MLGGTINFQNSISNYDDSQILFLYPNAVQKNSLKVLVQPEFGICITNRFVLGGHVGYTIMHHRFRETTPEVKNISVVQPGILSIGLLLRRNFIITDKFFVSLDGIPYYQINNGYIGLRIRPMLTYLPFPKLGFEAGLGNIEYSYFRGDRFYDKSHNFNFNLGAVTLGLRYYMRKKTSVISWEAATE